MFRIRIRQLREAAGYSSQQSFADVFGVAQSTVAGWEAGKREPNYATTLRLADFFGVTVDYLLGRASEPGAVSAPAISPAPGPVLSDDERRLLELYRRLPNDLTRGRVYGFAESLLASQEKSDIPQSQRLA